MPYPHHEDEHEPAREKLPIDTEAYKTPYRHELALATLSVVNADLTLDQACIAYAMVDKSDLKMCVHVLQVYRATQPKGD
jgi:hypothetical protein